MRPIMYQGEAASWYGITDRKFMIDLGRNVTAPTSALPIAGASALLGSVMVAQCSGSGAPLALFGAAL